MAMLHAPAGSGPHTKFLTGSRELFQRLDIIIGFFTTGMNGMDGDEKMDKC